MSREEILESRKGIFMNNEELDNHRRDLINEFCGLLTQHKDYVNTTTEEIRDILINKRDRDRFSEEDITRSLNTFLRKQKGISPLRVKNMWEIRPPLKP